MTYCVMLFDDNAEMFYCEDYEDTQLEDLEEWLVSFLSGLDYYATTAYIEWFSKGKLHQNKYSLCVTNTGAYLVREYKM